MKVGQILEHFLSRADWVDRDKTTDRILVGDPDTPVDHCLVTWMPSFNILRRMVDRNERFLICHESALWAVRNGQPVAERPGIEEKLAYAQHHGLVILRNHDCWDKWPHVGIPWAWGRFLGLGDAPAAISEDRCHHRYDIDPVPFEVFARRVAERCAAVGEPRIQVIGDPAQPVSRIGAGTGCGCDIHTYQRMGCDCSIVCDDGSCYWDGIQRAEDCGHPVIRVNHGTSEEPGMIAMTQYINDHLDGVRAEHIPYGCAFRLVDSEGP